MASTYSTNLAIELIGTGDQAGSWGNTTNTNLGTLIEQAISGYVTQAVSTGTDTTITIPNGATGVARNMYIELTGTGGTNTNLIVPANKKLYFIFNNTSSGQVTVKVSGQTGVSVPNKAKMILVSNGTDIVDATNYIGNISAASANITVLTSASATITNLIATSASITTLTNNPTFGAGTANGVLYLNGSKVATSGSALTFDGSYFTAASGTGTFLADVVQVSGTATKVNAIGVGLEFRGGSNPNITSYSRVGSAYLPMTLDTSASIFSISGTEAMRITSTSLYTASGINVGIGTSSPSAKLHVKDATGTAVTLLNLESGYSNPSGNKSILWTDATNALGRISVSYTASTGSTMSFGSLYNGGYQTSDLMVLTNTGNLGIGTASPSTKLTVYDATTPQVTFNNGTSTFIVGNNSGGNNKILYGTGAYPMIFYTNATEAMKIDASQNLGLGVTPSAVSASDKVVQVGAFLFNNNTNGYGILRYNNFFNGTNDVYYGNGGASAFQMFGNAFRWYQAASGTAGNTITFTQAMTLSAAGGLTVGGTTDPGAGRILAEGSGTSHYVASSKGGVTTTYLMTDANGANVQVDGAWPIRFTTNSTERGRFTAGGYFKASDAGTYNNSTGAYHELRQTANDTCAYISATNASMAYNVIAAVATRGASSAFNFLSCAANSVDQFYVRGDGVVYAQNTTIQSISDARLKENVRDASEGLNVINALRSVRYDWKEGFGNNRKDQLGFIAQEVEAVFPDAVSEWKAKEGEEAYKTVGPAALIPVLVKAIQELSAKVAALEAK